ncbi:YueI family protein [Peribacillus saganii]|uniref:YueI family protein n=1 Tax=Peribacillus saganii TaxID=2303992 RepID=UPI001F2097E1|nr:YueI family protein [Peribacillus saganii]
MPNKNVDDYLQEGIYGKKELKPEERKRFLGTLRERVVLALTQAQVMEKNIYPEAEQAMKANPQAYILINGNLDFSYQIKYIKAANKHGLKYTIVNNTEHNSDIGLLIAYDHAVDKPEIFISRKTTAGTVSKKPARKGLFQKIKSVFSKS